MIKIQYPVQLHQDTKCPSCNTGIKEIGTLVYVCDTGHVLEALVLVTMRPKKKQEPVQVKGIVEDDRRGMDDSPLTPSYNKGKMQ